MVEHKSDALDRVFRALSDPSRRRILRSLAGRAREGTVTPSVQFDEFVTALRARLPDLRMKERLGSTGSTFEITLTLLAPPPAAPAEEEETL